MYSHAIQELIEELGKLPTVGPKTAQRLAFYLMKRPVEEAEKLAMAIIKARKGLQECRICYNLCEQEICRICSDAQRKNQQLCVVCTPQELSAIERTDYFKGRYHVLGGALSPMEGIGPDSLRVAELVQRLGRGAVQEVILATSLTLQGEATSLYLARLLLPLKIKITRLATGLPIGADLEYADSLTLCRALEGRKEIRE